MSVFNNASQRYLSSFRLPSSSLAEKWMVIALTATLLVGALDTVQGNRIGNADEVRLAKIQAQSDLVAQSR
jgi:hypothetical protein